MSSLDEHSMGKFICQWNGVGPKLLILWFWIYFCQFFLSRNSQIFSYPSWIRVLKHGLFSMLAFRDGMIVPKCLVAPIDLYAVERFMIRRSMVGNVG